MVQGFSIKSRKDNSNVSIFTTSKATSPVANWENWPPLRRMSKELLISDNTSLLLDASLIVAQVHSLFFSSRHIKNCGHGPPLTDAKNWLSIKPNQVNRSSVTLTKIWWTLVTWPRYTSLVNENLKFVRSPHRNRHSPCCIPFRLLTPLTGWFLLVWARA